jgi:hypothetical protein
MPEELVILLGILIGAIWLFVKISQGIAGVATEVTKSYRIAKAKRKHEDYLKGRTDFRQYVHARIPDDLDSCEKHYALKKTEFEQAQRLTKSVARPPIWKKEDFQGVVFPVKDSSYSEMCVEDIDVILTPNSESSTWLHEESQIVSHHCKYPYGRPICRLDKLNTFPAFGADIETAEFQIDAEHIGKKDLERYFFDEQSKVEVYNKRRVDLISRIANLNLAIDKWNRESRSYWEVYVKESKRMEETAFIVYQQTAELYAVTCRAQGSYFKTLQELYRKGEKKSVIERLDFVLDRIDLPTSIPHTWEIDFDNEEQIAVIDFGLPDVYHRPPYKTVFLKSGTVRKGLNQTERKEFIPKVHPAILLRIAYEIFRTDLDETIKLLVLNGWIRFPDPATGINTQAYTASLMVRRDQIEALNLNKIDPVVAFNNLHGKSAGKLVEIIPIEPVLSLNRRDSRFVSAKEVLKGLGSETNLASMDWQDFEHLIRELFEKEFSGKGAEVKVTQASRDRGVDAIVFDPDPIRGGKYIIQAKRYTNTVDVSAVRDLCAVVSKEGASRGILVTTSTYGADAYAFANNEPITLLNGSQLLGLLKKHGYTFRINLQEARRSG